MEDFVDRVIILLKERNDTGYRMLTNGPDSVLQYWRHPDGEEAKGKKPQQKFNKLLRAKFRAQDLGAASNDEQRFLYHSMPIDPEILMSFINARKLTVWSSMTGLICGLRTIRPTTN
jgi:hypothetical protein